MRSGGITTIYTVLSPAGGRLPAAIGRSGLEKRVLKLKNFAPGFLKTKKAADGARRRLRRPEGIRASTMVIPMPPEIRSAMAEPAPAEPPRSRRRSARPARPPAAREPVDETMLLLPTAGPEETMRMPPQPAADDTVRIRRGRRR